MDLRPRLDQPLLRFRQAAAETLDVVHGEDRCLFLVIRVEVRSVMLAASFHKHPDDDPGANCPVLATKDWPQHRPSQTCRP